MRFASAPAETTPGEPETDAGQETESTEEQVAADDDAGPEPAVEIEEAA